MTEALQLIICRTNNESIRNQAQQALEALCAGSLMTQQYYNNVARRVLHEDYWTLEEWELLMSNFVRGE